MDEQRARYICDSSDQKYVLIPGSIEELCRHGTEGHGLVMRLSRSGWWLDVMTLKVFSNLHDPVIINVLKGKCPSDIWDVLWIFHKFLLDHLKKNLYFYSNMYHFCKTAGHTHINPCHAWNCNILLILLFFYKCGALEGQQGKEEAYRFDS